MPPVVLRPPPTASETHAGAATARIPGLDGLRGLAVAGVLAFHAGLPGGSGGFLGVSAFFTLSGFLITGLLLDEHAASGRIDLRRFWVRRARRLLPAALAALVLIAAYAFFAAGPTQLRALRGDVVGALAYVANWRFVLDGSSYAALWQAPSPVQHFWSLAVEEQVYLLFPLLATLALGRSRWGRARLAALLVAGTAASLAAMVAVYDGGEGALRAYYGTDTRLAEVLVGALLAVGVRTGRGASRRPGLRSAVGGVALLGMLASWAVVAYDDAGIYRGGLLVHAVAVATVIAGVLVPGPLASALSVRPLRWLGRLSYGAYLYHWPLFLWLSPQRTGLRGLPLAALQIAVSLALAALSHRLLEEPIRYGARLRGARRAVPAVAFASVGVAVLTVAVTVEVPAPPTTLAAAGGLVAPSARASASAGLALVQPPLDVGHQLAPPDRTGAPTARLREPVAARVAPEGSAAGAAAQPAVPLVQVLPGERPRVLVVGDSNAYVLGIALQEVARRDGMDVWASGVFACHVVRGGSYRFAGIAKATEPPCNEWEQRRAKEVAEVRPHLAVVTFGIFDVLDRQLPGEDSWTHVGEPEFDALLRQEMRAMTDLLRRSGVRVAWLTLPAFRTGLVDGVLPVDPYPEWDLRRIDRYNEILREVVAATPGASVIDLRSHLRSLPGGELDLVRRPDGIHPTDAFARELAGWLSPQVRQVATRP